MILQTQPSANQALVIPNYKISYSWKQHIRLLTESSISLISYRDQDFLQSY